SHREPSGRSHGDLGHPPFVGADPAWPGSYRPALAGGDAMLERVPDRAGAIGHADLAIDVGQVELDRVLADPELTANGGGGETGADSGQDRLLPVGQRARR